MIKQLVRFIYIKTHKHEIAELANLYYKHFEMVAGRKLIKEELNKLDLDINLIMSILKFGDYNEYER